MATKAHVKKAFKAMNDLGITDAQVKPVLKNLLIVYDRNWELIAEDNYKALADAIFDNEETQVNEERNGKEKKADEAEGSAAEVDRGKKKVYESVEEDEDALDEPEPPLKRLRRRGEGASVSALNSPDSGSPNLKRTTHDEEIILLPFRPLPTKNDPDAVELTLSKDGPYFVDMPFSSIHAAIFFSLIKVTRSSLHCLFCCDEALKLLTSKLICVLYVFPWWLSLDSLENGSPPVPISEMEKTNGHVKVRDGETVNTVDGATNYDPRTTIERSSEHKMATTLEEASALELASSETGEVKINLSFAPATGGSNLHVPTMEELRRAMEDKCLRSYKILDPNFSVGRFMNDICSCYLELAKKAEKSSSQSPENLPFLTTNFDVLKKSAATMAFTYKGSNDLATKAKKSANQSPENFPTNVDALKISAATMDVDTNGTNDHMRDEENGKAVSMGLVVVPECQISADEFRLISSISDITLGKETVEIPWVNQVNSKVPPLFRYIAQSHVYLDAAVKFSLGNIRDDQCCSSCCGDCLAPSMTCSCATALSGFTYTQDGLLQKDFLEECISEARDPQKHLLQYCKECPLEKAKSEEILEQCKGHLKRKVIKECWSNCGCIKKCGNRLVQHGIHNKLQVFFTPNGRGWGLRTLEKLPKGAFVCEFAGEILTISELIQRSSEKLTSPVILDAHWGSEAASGVNKALCLDGTHFGNISRFINHRCSDSNLIEIPVYVENMDLHYYHLAFFTTRDIEAMEELTWDYGVEFNDHVCPTLPFHCQCGSEFCRNVKRISKSKKAKKRA